MNRLMTWAWIETSSAETGLVGDQQLAPAARACDPMRWRGESCG
jgi:hypothetical protein